MHGLSLHQYSTAESVRFRNQKEITNHLLCIIIYQNYYETYVTGMTSQIYISFRIKCNIQAQQVAECVDIQLLSKIHDLLN